MHNACFLHHHHINAILYVYVIITTESFLGDMRLLTYSYVLHSLLKRFISSTVTPKAQKVGRTDAPFLLGENCSDIENPSPEITAPAVRSAGIMSRFGYEFTFAFSSNRLHISSPTNNESFRTWKFIYSWN